jgi:hypothetical protein
MIARLCLVVALALAGAACGFKPAVESSAKEPAYTFPHSTHVDADVACTQCHAGIQKATKIEPGVRHVQLPASPSKEKACADCHDKDPEIRVPTRTRASRIRFSHADHLARVSDCRRCHRELTEPGQDHPRVPPMEACTACHNHQMDFAQSKCRPCHVDLKGYKPETAFRHEGDWLRSHGSLARPSAETCVQCHDQTYCAECHSSATTAARPSIIFPERVDRAFIHRGDYVSRHMVDARANPASCKRCHGSGFCEACHTQQGLSQFAGTVRDPHPAGWSGPPHAQAARRNIGACAGCHDQGAAAVCTTCHRSLGPGAGQNPHPSKFRSTHDRGDISKNALCRACHTAG